MQEDILATSPENTQRSSLLHGPTEKPASSRSTLKTQRQSTLNVPRRSAAAVGRMSKGKFASSPTPSSPTPSSPVDSPAPSLPARIDRSRSKSMAVIHNTPDKSKLAS